MAAARHALRITNLEETTMSLDTTTYATYVGLLEKELVCALGCTEPIALAYASALAGRLCRASPASI